MHPVIVVGGGPAGASTAWHLARLGVDVTVLDRARFPRDKVCGDCLNPDCWPVFDRLGVTARLLASVPAAHSCAG